ncbi:MAG: Mu-like prophage major head subunit gpT family protein [Prevotella sp.]|jgi:phage major head subunit gpT-like protein|nr:Mu-like prophage major head subunit gpT family protein [Prevotella sp.]
MGNSIEQIYEQARKDAADAILNRIAPNTFKDVNGYRSMSLMEIGQSFLKLRRVPVAGKSKDEIAGMLLCGRDMSTSDFPLLLEDVANKMLRNEYGLAPEYWDKIARRTSVTNYKDAKLYQIGSANGMKELAEGEELKYGKLQEAAQTIRVKSYAEGLKFTRQMIINDDLSAFETIPQKFGRDWNLLRGDLVWGMIKDNAVMPDGNAFFSAAHNNLSPNPDQIGEDSLTEALLAFRTQTGIDGEPIRAIPKYLIVSPEQEIRARKLLTLTMATNTGDVNVFSTMGLELIVEHRLEGTAWYLAADPNAIDGLQYAYLGGTDTLRTNREDNFDTDSIKLGVRGDFGVAAIDWRGWYKNAGE